MKSATLRSRLGRFGVLVVGAAAVIVMGAPTAQATMTPVACDSGIEESELQGSRVGSCSPATGDGGLGELTNRNPVRQNVDQLNTYFGSRNPGGPVQAFQRQTKQDRKADGTALAMFLDRNNGADMIAGYTPRETTGQFIQRWLQPLRDHNVNAWSNISWSSPRDTHRPTRYDSDIWTLTVGADMPIMNENLIFGVFGSYTHSDVDTSFNRGDVESKLGTVGPYFVYSIGDYLSFDTTVAGIFGQNENIIGSRTPGVRDARGEQDVDGFFVSMNANANYWVGNWGVQGRLGFLHSDTETESYDLGPQFGGPGTSTTVRVPGTNNELTQLSVAAQINHFYDKGLPFCEDTKAMPFFRITFNYDLDHDNIPLPFGVYHPPNDDDEVVLNWGVTLFGNGPFSGSVEAGRTFARSRFESWAVSGTLAYAF